MKKKILLTSDIYLFNKKFKKNEYYHYFQTKNVSIIIPFYKQKFLLVSQKRIPIKKINFEFTSGQVDKLEKPFKSANRELVEETGYKSLKTKKLINFYSEPGRLTTKNFCYYSDNLIQISKPEPGIKIHFMTKKEVITLIKNNKFNSSSHISAFLYFLMFGNK